jgi:hypothetical protein
LIWSPPVVGKETDKELFEKNWDACCNIALERFAELVFDELQTKDPNDVNSNETFNCSCQRKQQSSFCFFLDFVPKYGK